MAKDSQRAKDLFTASGELREGVEGNLKDEVQDVWGHTGLVQNPTAMELMNQMASAYKPLHPEMPSTFDHTDAGEMMIKAEATKVATEAVDEGNISQMKYITGMQDYTADASGIHTLIQLRQKIKQDAYIAYVWGHMGGGKTDFCNLMGELAKKEMGYEVASNQKTLYENGDSDKYIWQFGDFIRWLAEGHEITSVQDLAQKDLDIDASDKLFIFDEGSNYASGYSGDAHDAQDKLGSLVKLIRKLGGNLIIIGHTGKDIHPDIRRLTNDCIYKSGQKTAKFFHAVEEAEGVGHKHTIGKIPQTNWNYDTLEVCIWDWSVTPQEERKETADSIEQSVSTEQRNMEMAKAYVSNSHPDIKTNENGKITMEMIANHYDLSVGRVSQIFKEIEQEADEMEGVA